MIFQHWGATDAEIEGPMVGDDLVPDARLVATRSISLTATPEAVYPWLRQMGFRRAGWYSYDLIDNLGRRSARAIDPRWQDVNAGDRVPAGPLDFEATIVEPPRAFVLRLGDSGRASRRVRFSLAYELRPDDAGTRLVTRVRARLDLPLGRLVERLLLGPGDGIMLRKQLLSLADRTRVSTS
ncbi:MAG: hypothetical protein RLZZ368_284 [Actinomycetota bacterium]